MSRFLMFVIQPGFSNIPGSFRRISWVLPWECGILRFQHPRPDSCTQEQNPDAKEIGCFSVQTRCSTGIQRGRWRKAGMHDRCWGIPHGGSIRWFPAGSAAQAQNTSARVRNRDRRMSCYFMMMPPYQGDFIIVDIESKAYVSGADLFLNFL